MQQVLVTIGPKSQVVIPKNIREAMPQLKPGRKVVVRSIDARSVIVEVLPKDWVAETYGMHKRVWKGVDATQYIHKLREEWKRGRWYPIWLIEIYFSLS